MSGIVVVFDRKVEKTISELQIGTQTLITRFGGIIGVGKNLLWVIILIFTSVEFCASKAKKTRDSSKKIVQSFTGSRLAHACAHPLLFRKCVAISFKQNVLLAR